MNLKYRLIDGKHRVEKMLKSGIKECKFYILGEHDIINHLKRNR